jgi:hypothetical protein
MNEVKEVKEVKYGHLSSVAYYIKIQNVLLTGTGNIKIKENNKILYEHTYEESSVLNFTVSMANDRDFTGCLYRLNGIVIFKDPYLKGAVIEYNSTFDCKTSTFEYVDH